MPLNSHSFFVLWSKEWLLPFDIDKCYILHLGKNNPNIEYNMECQTPNYSKHLHQISPPCLTHYTIGHCGQLNMHYHQTNYPSSPQSTYNMTTDDNKTDGHSLTNYKTGHNSWKTQSPLSFRPPYPPIYTLLTEFSQASY